mgnify:CR=1 FL=1
MRKIVVDMQNFLFADSVATAKFGLRDRCSAYRVANGHS